MRELPVKPTSSYKIIFAGTPHFAVPALQALKQSSHKVIAVYTQPDRPSGRGQKLSFSPIKMQALEYDLPIYQPQHLKNVEDQQILTDLNADLMVVVAYGLILPTPVLQAPKLGCINIHASLLPRWRGAAPIQRAIVAGDDETGITIMQMDKGLDTGAMLYRVSCKIAPSDSSESLQARLSTLGAEALLHTLNHINHITPTPQDHTLATYAHKITKIEAEIDWTLPAFDISNQIRGFNPWPIAYTYTHDVVLRIWQASVLDRDASKYTPGEIMALHTHGIEVATGRASLRIEKLQLPGGRVLSVADILNGKHEALAIGKILGKNRESSSAICKRHL